MRMHELPQSLEKFVGPFRKENVLSDALEEFSAQYANDLLTIIPTEQKYALDSVILLTYTKGKFTIETRAQLWWCTADLIDYLQRHEYEVVSNRELFSLLNTIQHLCEPGFPVVSKDSKRELLYIAWYRLQNNLKNSLLTESIMGGNDQLDSWIADISKVLEASKPTKSQNHRANWAAGGLLDTIDKLENKDNLIEIVRVLKRIQKITK